MKEGEHPGDVQLGGLMETNAATDLDRQQITSALESRDGQPVDNAGQAGYAGNKVEGEGIDHDTHTDSRGTEAPAEPTAPQTEGVQQGESTEAGQGTGAEGESSHKDIKYSGKDTEKTKLYRVMSDAEYQSIINNGDKFSAYDRAMEEKWFATSPEDATKWAEKFYPDGQYKMIEIEVPTIALNQMYQVEKLDGIGPAYSGGIDFLNSIMRGIKLR